MNSILQSVTDYRAMGALLEDKPLQFEIETTNGEKKPLSVYPFQLGRLLMISQRLLDLDLLFDEQGERADPIKQMWEVCATKSREVAEILAIATLRSKEELDTQLEERTEEILWSPSMTPNAFAQVLFRIVQSAYYGDFIKAIRSVEMLRVEICPKTQAGRIAYTGGKPSSGE